MPTSLTFTTYALPAMIALLAKAGMYFYARYSNVHNAQTRLYLLFLFSLSIQNITEITIFTNLELGLPNLLGGRMYYGASAFVLAFLFHLALLTATDRPQGKDTLSWLSLSMLYAPVMVIEVLLWQTNLLIVGFERMNYTVTKIPGPWFFLWEVYAIGYLFAAVGFLVYGAITQTSSFRRRQNKLLLLGLAPFFLIVFAVITLQRFGFRAFNATVTLPFAVTFFLAVTAYAIHQYRLFDIAFFIPWSKVRKRKTVFYTRIQALIAEIADISSVNKVVQSLSAALNCPVVLIGGPKPAIAMAGDAFSVARFPREELKKIDHIVIANEIAEAHPDTFALMRRHKVAAVVPFHPHSEAAASWMLLGEAFSEHVYTPLDFKVVESLFDRLADHFLDKQLLLRSQLSEAQREMHLLQERLASAWEQLEVARKAQRVLERENHHLQRKGAQLLPQQLAEELELELTDEAITGKKTLDECSSEFEARLVEKVLEHCRGDRTRAAQILGLTPYTLHRKCLRFGLDTKIK